MSNQPIKLSTAAKKFMEKNDIRDVTFKLKVMEAAGCCLGVVKEIEPTYASPENASGYYYYQAEGCHVFVSRAIKILGPLTLTTEGLWKKRLVLTGATVPI
jgi:hypothetical protein